jgi:predicted DNA-binding transcriptional regulator AlpA
MTALLLTAAELADELRVSRSGLYRALAAGRLPVPIRPTAGAPRWRRDEITAWIAAGAPPRSRWVWPPAGEEGAR